MHLNNFRVISILIILTTNIVSQTNPATARRDWYVGHYVGMLKDSTANITVPCSFDIYWTQNHPTNPYPLNDSCITIPMGSTNRYVVCADSTIYINGGRYCMNAPNPVGYGVLKTDLSLYYVFTSVGGCACSATVGSSHCNPGNVMVFHGTKTSSTPLSVDERDLQTNSAVVFPNPAQEHINVLTFVEFDNMELYDLLGKSYDIALNKTSSGYHIDLPASINAGIYFLRMRRGNESIIRKVMVKQRE